MSNQKESGKENFTGTGGGDIRILIEDLSETVTNITKAGFRTIILIDALNKVDDIGKTNKVINLTSCLTENWSYKTNTRNSVSMIQQTTSDHLHAMSKPISDFDLTKITAKIDILVLSTELMM